MVRYFQAASSAVVRGRVDARRVHAHRLFGVGWLFARTGKPAGPVGLVLALPRTGGRAIGRRADVADGAPHSDPRVGDHRVGAVAVCRPDANGGWNGRPTRAGREY